MDIVRTEGRAPGRSHAVCFDNIVWTVATADDKSGDLRAQTADALRVIDRNLAHMGTDKSRLLSVTVYITDMACKSDMNDAWLEWVDMHHAPQRACLCVGLDGDAKIEIVALAAKKTA